MKEQWSELEYEKKRLEETLVLIREQIQQAKTYNEKKKEEIILAKQELRENTVHSIPSLWSSDGFEALAELNQYANPVTDKIADYEEVEQKILLLEKSLEAPYFARIDFRFAEEEDFEKIYIGRSSLKENHSHELLVYDWRSPIASVFYRFVLGPAFYDAPGGRINGEVSLKRQYEIAHGVLEYFFDADVQIVDEFLRKLLSQNTSSKMKAIVETIQREQDIVIRDMENDLMMVQGVAGSGKTSIALHRAAYLMYQGLSSKLSASNIMIISPNPLFEQYISDVLPELGESNIVSAVFEEIAAAVLKRGHLQSRNQFLEQLLTGQEDGRIMKRCIEFKTSRGFGEVLARFVHEMPLRWIVFEDVYWGGTCIVKKEVLRSRVSRREDIPLSIRLKQLEEYVVEQISEQRGKRLKKAETAELKAAMKKFTELNVLELYKQLFADEDYFYCLMKAEEQGDDMGEIFRHTRENLNTNMLYYDDIIALTYLKLKLYGTDLYPDMKQVVIDEAQDYYPLQYEIFRMLFSNAKFTVLGDMNQTLEKQEDVTLYSQISEVLKKKKFSLVTMDKSFRCTTEILNYSLRFIFQRPEIKSFNRSGQEPQVYKAKDWKEFDRLVIDEVMLCKEKGYKSIGLICKTEKSAIEVYSSLKKMLDIQLIKNGSMAELQGVFIIPLYMSKGLEFDAVLLCDADAQSYNSEDDKKLLYISCTRALHRLNLFCRGEVSPLVTG